MFLLNSFGFLKWIMEKKYAFKLQIGRLSSDNIN